MRKILFRGKHIHEMSCNKRFDGQWVYGYLCDEKYINSAEYGEMLVDPETVGQYTGEDDENGEEVFEGDIIKVLGWDSANNIFIIKFDEGSFTLENAELFMPFTMPELVNAQNLDGFYKIGNVYDNPELLRK